MDISKEMRPKTGKPKSPEELNAIKKEVESLSRKLAELTDEELTLVIGGTDLDTQKDHYENLILGSFPSPTITNLTLDSWDETTTIEPIKK